MKKSFLAKFILLCFILNALTACDDQTAPNTAPRKHTVEEEKKLDDTYKFEKRVQEESSQTETLPQPKASEIPQKQSPERKNKADSREEHMRKQAYTPESSQHLNKKNHQKNSNNPQKRKNVPVGWIDRNVQKKTSATSQQIWKNIISAIDKLIFARKVIYAPLGTRSSELKKISDGKYKVSVRCIVIEQNGERIPYLLECIALANHYDANILKLEFEEPNI